jgi:hypothetical protein
MHAGWNIAPDEKKFVTSSNNDYNNIALVNKRIPNSKCEYYVFGLDVDILDEALATEFREYLISEYGEQTFMIRYGKRPKFMAVFKTSEIITTKSGKNVKTIRAYSSDGNNPHIDTVEQFVAFGQYANTSNIYEWEWNRHPFNTPVESLPLMNLAEWEKTAKMFIDICANNGLGTSEVKAKHTKTGDASKDEEALMNAISSKENENISESEVLHVLKMIEDKGVITPSSSYQDWYKLMCALVEWGNSTNNLKRAKEIAHEFSARSKTKYSYRAFIKQWDDLVKRVDLNLDKITIRTLIYYANKDTVLTLTNALNKIVNSNDFTTFFQAVAKSDITSIERNAMVNLITDKARSLGIKLTTKFVEEQCQMLIPEGTYSEWVYVLSTNSFYHPKYAKNGISKDSICCYFLSKGLGPKTINIGISSNLIPVYPDVDYVPYSDVVFEVNKTLCYNNWDSDTAPVDLYYKGRGNKDIAKRIERFFKLVYGDNSDCAYLMDLISTIARNRGKPLGILILIVHTLKGSGKTMTTDIMKAVVGYSNASDGPHVLNPESSFDKFGQACLIVCNDSIIKSAELYSTFMREIVSGKTVHVEYKYENPKTVANIRTFVFTHNDPDKFYFDSNDRRVAVFTPILNDKTDIELLSDVFADMVDLLSNQDNHDWIYSYFLNRSMVNEIVCGASQAKETAAARRLASFAKSEFQQVLYDYVLEYPDTIYIPRVDLMDICRQNRIKLPPIGDKMDKEAAALGYIRVRHSDGYRETACYVNKDKLAELETDTDLFN